MKKVVILCFMTAALCALGNKEDVGERSGLPGKLRDYFVYDKNDPLKRTVDSSYMVDDIVVRILKLENDSSHIYFDFMYPENPDVSVPVIFYQHWGEGDVSEFYQEALKMSHDGFACVLMMAPWLKQECYNKSFMKNGYNLYREGALDWVKTSDYLFQHYPFLDSNKVCFVGHSYGAQIAGMLSGLKPSLKGIVFMAGTASTTGSIKESNDSTILAWRKNTPVQYKDWLRNMRPFDPEYYLPFYHGNILLQYARQDEFKIDSAQAMEIKQYSNAQRAAFKYYNCTHALDIPEVSSDRIAWIISHCK